MFMFSLFFQFKSFMSKQGINNQDEDSLSFSSLKMVHFVMSMII